MSTKRAIVGAWLAVSLPIANTAPAATVLVPGDYPTIQAGVDAATAGDSVLVAPGTWTDYEVRGTRTACVFLKDGVVLLSEIGPLVTTIDMQGQGTSQPDVIVGIVLSSGTTAVEGFTITGAPVGSGGVFLVDSEKVTFRNCIFRDVDGGAVAAGGIGARHSDVDVIACEFRDLRTSASGAGISQSDADLFVDGCTFTNCVDRAINCLGLTTSTPESAVITNCTFIGNATTSAGGGAVAIAAYELGATIAGCWFEGNVADVSGGAVHFANQGFAPVVVQDCVFWNNTTVVGGGIGGAIAGAGAGTIRNNTFVGNGTAGGGAAVNCQAGQVEFTENVVSDCQGAVAVRQGTGGVVVPDCNVYWNNTGGNTSGFSMASTSREVDPLYCDPPSGDFTVAQNSPCLPGNSLGCGLIGALGQGCGPVSVESRSWGMIKEGYR